MKKTVNYDKIVRDKIPEIIEATGGTPSSIIADKEQAIDYLLEKINEETQELKMELKAGNHEEIMEELADILEVIHGLAHHLEIPLEKLDQVRKEKRYKRGAFEKKIILKQVLK